MQTLQLGDATIDLQSGRFERGPELGNLTRKETALMAYLADRAEQVVSHDTLLQQVWGYRPGTKTFTVYSTVRRVRKKLEDDPKAPRWLCTAPGGYILHVPVLDGESFIGRGPELERLATFEGQWCTLTGPPGAGTTRLAQEFCTREGGTWIDLSRVSVDDAARILRDADGLVVLDGAQPSPIWADLPRCWVVATSRAPLGLPNEQGIRLGELARDEALQLVRARRPESPADAVRALVDRVDRLPLVLHLLASWMERLSTDDLSSAIHQPHQVLRARDERPGVDTVFAAALGTASEPDRKRLDLLSLFEGPFTLSAASRIVGDGAWLGDSMERLHTDGLLERTDLGRFFVLRCLRSLCGPEARRERVDSHRDWFSGLAADGTLVEEDVPDAWAALDSAMDSDHPTEAGHLLRALAAAGLPGAHRLIEGMEAWLDRWPDHPQHWPMLEAFGAQCRRTGQYSRGIERLAPVAANGPASARICLGTLWIREGQADAARSILESGLELATQKRDLHTQGAAWMALGVLALDATDSDDAERCFRNATDLYRAAEEPLMECRALNNLGHMQRRQGDLVRAESSYREALALCRAEESRDRALVMSGVGIISLYVGRLDDALELLVEVDRIHRANHDSLRTGQNALNIGLCHLQREAYDDADEALETARRIAVRLGDTRLQVMSQASLAEQRLAVGDLRDATHRFEGALALAESAKRPDLAAPVRPGLAICDLSSGEASRFTPGELLADVGPAVDVFDGALIWLRMVRLDPENRDAHLARADALIRGCGMEENVGLARARRRLTNPGSV